MLLIPSSRSGSPLRHTVKLRLGHSELLLSLGRARDEHEGRNGPSRPPADSSAPGPPGELSPLPFCGRWTSPHPHPQDADIGAGVHLSPPDFRPGALTPWKPWPA